MKKYRDLIVMAAILLFIILSFVSLGKAKELDPAVSVIVEEMQDDIVPYFKKNRPVWEEYTDRKTKAEAALAVYGMKFDYASNEAVPLDQSL